jgi:hypothetical protein
VNWTSAYQALSDDPVKCDFVVLAREAADVARDVIPEIKKQLDGERKDVVGPKRLERYVGKYCNEVRTLCIWVRQGQDGLWMDFQGIEVENYEMRHYDGDVLEWLMVRDEMVKRGRNPVGYALWWVTRAMWIGCIGALKRIFRVKAWNSGKIRNKANHAQG